jgi:hypothetical protein
MKKSGWHARSDGAGLFPSKLAYGALSTGRIFPRRGGRSFFLVIQAALDAESEASYQFSHPNRKICWRAVKPAWRFCASMLSLKALRHASSARKRPLRCLAEDGLAERQSLASGVEKDKAVVQAGLTCSVNNRMVEGFVIKIKTHQETNIWKGRICPAAPMSTAYAARIWYTCSETHC